jgi:hypothetical protein
MRSVATQLGNPVPNVLRHPFLGYDTRFHGGRAALNSGLTGTATARSPDPRAEASDSTLDSCVALPPCDARSRPAERASAVGLPQSGIVKERRRCRPNSRVAALPELGRDLRSCRLVLLVRVGTLDSAELHRVFTSAYSFSPRRDARRADAWCGQWAAPGRCSGGRSLPPRRRRVAGEHLATVRSSARGVGQVALAAGRNAVPWVMGLVGAWKPRLGAGCAFTGRLVLAVVVVWAAVWDREAGRSARGRWRHTRSVRGAPCPVGRIWSRPRSFAPPVRFVSRRNTGGRP